MAKLTHLDADGAAHMVDVGDKPTSGREAVAEGFLLAASATLDAIEAADLPKGDAINTARIAGIMGAKKTADLIPLCHPLALSGVDISVERTAAEKLRVEASVRVSGKTGVEMEALTAVTTTLLTLYDMAKAIDKTMRFDAIRLLAKSGGQSGDFKAD